jgi:methionyl-tRNA formyltransferase
MTATNKTNIIFWGTPEICLPYLEVLEKENCNIVAVVTLPDRPVGRKQILTSPAPKVWAQERSIPVLQPEKLDQEFFETLKNFSPDISIVVAYGKIIPEKIINLPTYGTLNVHYSLLPRWRGATPVESAILAGDSETGVSIQKMVFELDAGDVIGEETIPLTNQDFAVSLKERLSVTGAQLLVKILPSYLAGTCDVRPQEKESVTKAGLIQKSDGEISLSENGEMLWRKWRAYTPWPGLFFFDEDGKRIKITEAVFENNQFIIKKVIPEGKKEITYLNRC